MVGAVKGKKSLLIVKIPDGNQSDVNIDIKFWMFNFPITVLYELSKLSFTSNFLRLLADAFFRSSLHHLNIFLQNFARLLAQSL